MIAFIGAVIGVFWNAVLIVAGSIIIIGALAALRTHLTKVAARKLELKSDAKRTERT